MPTPLALWRDLVRRGGARTPAADTRPTAFAAVVRAAAGAPSAMDVARLLGGLAAAHGLDRLDLLTWDAVVRDDPSRQQSWSAPAGVRPTAGPPAPQDLLLFDERGQLQGFARLPDGDLAGDLLGDDDARDLFESALTLLLERQLAARSVDDSRARTLQAHAELTDQRQRTAAAMDRTRRALEQDLHDGAQGDLVALGMRLRLRRTLIGTDLPPDVSLPEPADLLRDAHALRDRIAGTAAGLTPARLVDGGLPAALRHELPSDGMGRLEIVLAPDLERRRFPTEIEATVYFVCAEAVVNARKHAPGSDIRVEVRPSYRGVDLVVTDTGPGFDGSPGPGAFRAMKERIAAVSGHLDVTSTAASGTRVTASIPC